MKRHHLIFVLCLFLLGLSLFNCFQQKKDLAFYLDDEVNTNISLKGEAMFLKSVCDKTADITWNNDIWGLQISNLKQRINCKLYFSSDVSRPTWKVSNVSNTDGLTTDDYTIEITGYDDREVKSKLLVDDITFFVNEEACNVLKKSLEEVSSFFNEVKYKVFLSMLDCSGSLDIAVKEDTLIDSSNNTFLTAGLIQLHITL